MSGKKDKILYRFFQFPDLSVLISLQNALFFILSYLKKDIKKRKKAGFSNFQLLFQEKRVENATGICRFQLHFLHFIN